MTLKKIINIPMVTYRWIPSLSLIFGGQRFQLYFLRFVWVHLLKDFTILLRLNIKLYF